MAFSIELQKAEASHRRRTVVWLRILHLTGGLKPNSNVSGTVRVDIQPTESAEKSGRLRPPPCHAERSLSQSARLAPNSARCRFPFLLARKFFQRLFSMFTLISFLAHR